MNLRKGEYLGKTLRGYEGKHLSVKNTLHRRSTTVFHGHQNSYFSILLKGTYLEVTPESTKKITPGTIIFRPSEYKHQNIFEADNTRCFNLEIDADWLRKNEVKDAIHQPIIDKIGDQPFLFQSLVDFLRYQKIDLAEEIVLDYLDKSNFKSIPLRLPWIQKLKNILHTEIQKVHSLQSLSERVCVHPNYMSRAFKEKTGMSIGSYQMKVKLTNALQMLFTEKFNISDVSFNCGFFDDAHFIRSFKSRYGIPPHQFRLLLNS